MLINAEGEAFMNPLETRDVAAASIIRECSERHKGVKTPLGDAVWLDTPMIELKGGKGTIEKRIPAMMRMFGKHGIDIRTEPILVYPTLHYQNGGLHITPDGQTDVSTEETGSWATACSISSSLAEMPDETRAKSRNPSPLAR